MITNCDCDLCTCGATNGLNAKQHKQLAAMKQTILRRHKTAIVRRLEKKHGVTITPRMLRHADKHAGNSPIHNTELDPIIQQSLENWEQFQLEPYLNNWEIALQRSRGFAADDARRSTYNVKDDDDDDDGDDKGDDDAEQRDDELGDDERDDDDDDEDTTHNAGLKDYSVDVYHKGQHVGSENIKARDYNHAHRLASYIAPTIARTAVHPLDYEASRVSHVVNDPNEAAA